MSHELEIVNNVAQMFSVKKTPWHGLGVILEEAPSAEEAIVAAGLNWSVSKRQVNYVDQRSNDGSMIRVKDLHAIVRDSDETCLGSSGKDWQPLQNKDAFKFFDPFVNAGEASYETAGSLFNGKRIWVMAKINRDPIEVVKGDYVEKFILLTNCHKAGFAVKGGLTPIRVVCNNTLTGAESNKGSQLFRATHSNKMIQRLEDIQASIAMADQAFEQAAEAYRMFSKKTVTKEVFETFMSNVYQWSVGNLDDSKRAQTFQQKQTEAIERLFETGQGAQIKGVRGTLWGLYNAVTENVCHERGKDNEKRLEQSWFGTGMDINKRAFQTALSLVS